MHIILLKLNFTFPNFVPIFFIFRKQDKIYAIRYFAFDLKLQRARRCLGMRGGPSLPMFSRAPSPIGGSTGPRYGLLVFFYFQDEKIQLAKMISLPSVISATI